MPVRGQAGGIALFAKRGSAYMAEIGRRGALARKENAKTNIMAELQTIVAEIAEKAKANASWSNTIPDAISVDTVGERAGEFFCSLEVDLTQAPSARAFEYGSGIHSTKGEKETYPIFPKEKMALAFEWPGHNPDIKPNSGKFVGMTPDGRFMFYYVDHPGVEARPYLAPAVDEVLKTAKKRLAQAFIDAYVGEHFNETE